MVALLPLDHSSDPSNFILGHCAGFFVASHFIQSASVNVKIDAIEQMIASVTPKLSVLGGGVAATSGAIKNSAVGQNILTIADYGVVFWIFVGVSSLALQVVVFYRRDKREERMFRANMDTMKNQDKSK